jgi:hypothetical protein
VNPKSKILSKSQTIQFHIQNATPAAAAADSTSVYKSILDAQGLLQSRQVSNERFQFI